MMQIQELRVGVYVNLEDKGVYLIDSGQDIATIDNCWTGTDYCTGIPLTEEWLFNFGFETDYICFYKGNFNIGNFAGGVLIWLPTGSLSSSENGVLLKNVHQLQNLYFAITGSELALKPIVPEAK